MGFQYALQVATIHQKRSKRLKHDIIGTWMFHGASVSDLALILVVEE